MSSQLHFNICKETGVKFSNEHWCDQVPQSLERIMKVRLPYYGTKKCKPTGLL